MITAKTYAYFSSLITIGVLLNAYFLHKHFYSTVVHLTKSRYSLLTLFNFSVVMFLLICKAIVHLFFTDLKQAEMQHMQSKASNHGFRMVFILYCLHVDFDVYISLQLILNLAIGCLHWLAIKRSDYLFTERTHKSSYLKMFLLHLALLCCQILLALHFMKEEYMSLSLLLHYCYILMAVDIVKSLGFFCVNITEKICYPDGWDNKPSYLAVLDFVFSFVSLIVMLLEFNRLSRISSLYLLHFVDSLIYSGFKLFKQAKDFIRTRKLMHKVEKFPDATEEEINSANDKCIICFEEMNNAKRISCGHLFHLKCLKEYFQNNTHPECPTCKNPITDAVHYKPHIFTSFPKSQDSLKVSSILTQDLLESFTHGKQTQLGAVAWGLPQVAKVHKISKETEKMRRGVENMNSFMIRFYQHPPTEQVIEDLPQLEKISETRRIPFSALERLERGMSSVSDTR